ncbi:MAG: Crp/Fnr family transcriptional regulator [Candidatus Delongbacteria bacterium]|nr:Crp/Fnr family transcriptional regulator [Candidatus Delongbacteria bacterium]MBN2834632.1 Crp/Fnr family transcriptional regulator [Candidatus Delongbacteria bacterium]
MVKKIDKMTKDEVSEILLKSRICKNLDKQHIENIIAKSNLVVYKKNITIFEERQCGSFFFIILSGYVKVIKRYSDGKNPLIISILGMGDSFGEIALLNENKERSLTIVSIHEVSLLKVDHSVFENLYNSSMAFVKNLLQIALERLKHSNEQTKYILLSAKDAKFRVYFVFKMLIKKFASDQIDNEIIDLIIPFNNSELATFACMLKSNFSRLKLKMIEEGVIFELEKGHYQIPRYDQIMKLFEGV